MEGLKVKEVLPYGNEALTPDQLAYLPGLANRLGFTVRRPLPDLGEKVYEIAIHVALRNNNVVAAVLERVTELETKLPSSAASGQSPPRAS